MKKFSAHIPAQVSAKIFAAAIAAPFVISSTTFAPIVAAEEVAAKESKKKSVRVPAMRNRVYAQLARAQKLADEGDKIEGFNVLEEVEERSDSLNSYERAMLWNFYGFMYYGNDDVNSAVDSFQKVVAEEAIPESLRLSTLYSLAQLSMQLQDYDKTLDYLSTWKALNSKAMTANQEVLFAQVHFQNKSYATSLEYIDKAIALVTVKNEIPKENWLILQRANFYQLKQPKNVTKVIEQLVRHYNKPKYWLQLSGMYGEIGEEDKQLATMESAWQAGYITKSSDIVTLAQLYRYHGVPYKAGKLLADAIQQGVVAPEEKFLAMQAQSYVAAKDEKRAIPVLKQVAEISENGMYDAQLAQVYLNTEKWDLAKNYAAKAIDRGGLKGSVYNEGTMHLVIGMSWFNLNQYDQSLASLKKSSEFSQTKKVASQWLSYVEKEKAQQAQLAMVN